MRKAARGEQFKLNRHVLALTHQCHAASNRSVLSFETASFLCAVQQSTLQTNMVRNKFIVFITTCCACFVASSLNAVTIPAGTALAVSTVSSISSQDPVGRTFAAQIDRDVAIKGTVFLRAGTKTFGKIKSSRANPRKSEPLTLELTSISVNGRNVTVKTNSVQPGSSPRTARQAQYGHTAGTLIVTPGTKMQFQLIQPVTL